MRKIVVLLVLALVSFSTVVGAQETSSRGSSAGDVIGDILWIRPMGLIRTAIEGTVFAVSFPFIVLFDRNDKAKEFLVTDPVDYTFKRPLGEM
jgi:hypothetical protein